jgi:drug/metabolite transporter (DMT)-like permease
VPQEPIENDPEAAAAHKPFHLKTFLMILVMIVAGPLGNVLLGKGMKRAGPISLSSVAALMHTAMTVFSQPFIWLGIASLITFFISWSLALSWADYSFVRPASSLAYGVVALLSWFMLGERVSPLRWAGIAVICLGVLVVGRTAPKTTPRKTVEIV